MAYKNDALSAYDPNKLKLCELFNKLHTKSEINEEYSGDYVI